MIDIREHEYLSKLNHSAAHVMAQAISRIYPNAKFWVGPVIREGFYYDVDLDGVSLKEEDLVKIEKEMKKISKDGKRIVREEISKKDALEAFKNDPYKLELIENLNDGEITIYRQGDWFDLCRGPHVDTCKEVKYFKLLKVSGAYFKNDANNKMLQRIYGIVFDSEEALNHHLYLLEESKKRDHKKIGKEMGLFMVSEYSPGNPFFLPNGMIMRNILENYWYQEHEKENYLFIKTPIMMNQQLWETSGHWFNYRENMYVSEVDEKLFAIKPMNCPGCMLVYKNGLHSYKDLPIRIGELGHVHRHEASGALNGLFRVRSFTQDDAHIFMREDQIESEVVDLIGFIERTYKVFGLEYDIELSTRPEENYIGDIDTWNKSEEALANACRKFGKEFKINPGDGAFYGPKLDFKIKDSLGRVWQCGTIQLDMNLPERFDLTYVDSDGSKKRPIMLHRVIYGSIERFIGILIEHFAGNFPLWFAPVQISVLPVHFEHHGEYARKLNQQLKDLGFRSEVDDRNEKLGYRLREAQMKKIPLQIVIGDGEIEKGEVNLRKYGHKDSENLAVEDFITYITRKVENKEFND